MSAARKPIRTIDLSRSRVRLARTDEASAQAALDERRAALAAGVAAIRDGAGWDALVDSAGG